MSIFYFIKKFSGICTAGLKNSFYFRCIHQSYKAVTIQPMFSALNESRPHKEKDVIIDILYGRVRSAILDDPGKYSFGIDNILIHLSKQ